MSQSPSKIRRRGARAGAALLGAGAVLAVLAACTASTTDDVAPPITGFRIDTLGLFGVDSCGPADNQIAKVIVERSTPYQLTVDASEPATSLDEQRSAGLTQLAHFDCFVDPSFVESFAIPVHYDVMVYGFAASRYGLAGQPVALADGGTAPPLALEAVADVVARCVADVQANVDNTAACEIVADRRPGRGSGDASTDAGQADDGGNDADAARDASDGSAPEDAGDADDAAATDAASEAG